MNVPFLFRELRLKPKNVSDLRKKARTVVDRFPSASQGAHCSALLNLEGTLIEKNGRCVYFPSNVEVAAAAGLNELCKSGSGEFNRLLISECKKENIPTFLFYEDRNESPVIVHIFGAEEEYVAIVAGHRFYVSVDVVQGRDPVLRSQYCEIPHGAVQQIVTNAIGLYLATRLGLVDLVPITSPRKIRKNRLSMPASVARLKSGTITVSFFRDEFFRTLRDPRYYKNGSVPTDVSQLRRVHVRGHKVTRHVGVLEAVDK